MEATQQRDGPSPQPRTSQIRNCNLTYFGHVNTYIWEFHLHLKTIRQKKQKLYNLLGRSSNANSTMSRNRPKVRHTIVLSIPLKLSAPHIHIYIPDIWICYVIKKACIRMHVYVESCSCTPKTSLYQCERHIVRAVTSLSLSALVQKTPHDLRTIWGPTDLNCLTPNAPWILPLQDFLISLTRRVSIVGASIPQFPAGNRGQFSHILSLYT